MQSGKGESFLSIVEGKCVAKCCRVDYNYRQPSYGGLAMQTSVGSAGPSRKAGCIKLLQLPLNGVSPRGFLS